MSSDPPHLGSVSGFDTVDPSVGPADPSFVALLPSEAVARGAVVAADVGDLELVVWRTVAGEVAVTDARCPHQWSHLEAEGVVDGDELVCTSHFWRFDTRGCGSKLTVKGRRDPKADIETYPSREHLGVIEVALPPVPRTDSGAHDDMGGSAGRIL